MENSQEKSRDKSRKIQEISFQKRRVHPVNVVEVDMEEPEKAKATSGKPKIAETARMSTDGHQTMEVRLAKVED